VISSGKIARAAHEMLLGKLNAEEHHIFQTHGVNMLSWFWFRWLRIWWNARLWKVRVA
jgi:hypothetical protein